MSLKLQKRLAASILGCGKKRVWMDPNETNFFSLAKRAFSLRASLCSCRAFSFIFSVFLEWMASTSTRLFLKELPLSCRESWARHVVEVAEEAGGLDLGMWKEARLDGPQRDQ
mmetsp:Transcript_23185/g.27392  ORF Transcript_23185/g.27392 Transcript_23185/m.27392 type:complete len:113 (+) Transcript_23185:78-416(+)